MGEAVSSKRYTPEERTLYREKLAENLELFDTYLRHAEFKSAGTIGLELELNLIDEDNQPSLRNKDVLGDLDDEYQSEIGGFNLELNHPVLQVAGRGLKTLEAGVADRLAKAQRAAADKGLRVASIGTLPTLTTQFLKEDPWMTEENRYEALSNSVIDARGEFVKIELDGRETYRQEFADIAPESSCTSMQLHLQVAPNKFAEAWNASQAIAAAQVAVSANSPLFVGHKLWHESRIPVFTQSIDTRTPELVTQGVRPRVWFGERWITSVFDLFEENVRYFPPLLPEIKDFVEFSDADAPKLFELNLHNGTVWRWNRPIYDAGDNGAHIRVENRLLPAGPTPVDMVADAAFYYGLAEFLVGENRPVWSRMSFAEAEENFFACAKDGIRARVTWPKIGHIAVSDLVIDVLIPQARRGLRRLNIDKDVIEEYMSIIEGRASGRANGATWQLRMLDHLAPGSRPDSPERREGLKAMMDAYLENQASGRPVHTWDVPA
ncbi:glutamate-cysteine ligase family protein [Brevibacterium casei]|uniref:Glutamate--cysteine ligase n=4 Tax=Bacteria TaxID=2 RepID=A0A269ZH70_9MICO|nr:glutamate-cysteine ligase family protein [Brevibacterium casei]SIG87492.1 glutamate--cysteine ligase, GCS2 [Mycobacteroides abscessus subsp. abscessus]SMX64007.1 Glutamate-cysteine ligase family 2(GCS2) [Brevibacterium casei CIP 102111]MBE4695061.1 glutamate--cysteine ligase [Brevibacterium casei]MBY3578183.1 glutamate--cysteine ligase [Brevibacterium casei]MCT1445867.1 glutamate-cysteine ligase family protein [Brevibacterium casei]